MNKKIAKRGNTSGTNVERMRTCTSTTQDTGLVPAILARQEIFSNKLISYTMQIMYIKVDAKHMKKWVIGVPTSKGGPVRIMILQRGNVTYVNEKIIWEG